MRNRGNDVEEEPHSMVVIVLLILSASAIAMPPSGPILLPRKLQNEGVTNRNDRNVVTVAVTKISNIKVGSNTRETVNDVEEEPHLISVIVVLILSASAIAMPPLGPIQLPPKLRNEGGNKFGMTRMLLQSR
jgi:hypothetical protein